MTLGRNTLLLDHCQQCLEKNLQIKPKRQLLNVLNIISKPRFPGNRIPPPHLGQPRDPRQHLMPTDLLRRVKRQILDQQGPRAHQDSSRHAPHSKALAAHPNYSHEEVDQIASAETRLPTTHPKRSRASVIIVEISRSETADSPAQYASAHKTPAHQAAWRTSNARSSKQRSQQHQQRQSNKQIEPAFCKPTINTIPS